MKATHLLLSAAALLAATLCAQAAEMASRSWAVPPGFVKNPDNLEDELKARHITFPEGATVQGSTEQISLHNTKENINKLDELIQKAHEQVRERFIKSKRLTSARKVSREEDGTIEPRNKQQEALRDALRKAPIDSVKFERVWAEDMLDYLRAQLRRHGLQATLQMEKPKVDANTPPPLEYGITLEEKDLSCEKLLKLSCQQTGYRYEYTDTAIVLYRPDVGEHLHRKTWLVKREFLKQNGVEKCSSTEILELFKRQGIDFPKGCVLQYNPRTLCMTMLHTRTQLAKAEDFLASGNKKQKSSRKDKSGNKDDKDSRPPHHKR